MKKKILSIVSVLALTMTAFSNFIIAEASTPEMTISFEFSATGNELSDENYDPDWDFEDYHGAPVYQLVATLTGPAAKTPVKENGTTVAFTGCFVDSVQAKFSYSSTKTLLVVKKSLRSGALSNAAVANELTYSWSTANSEEFAKATTVLGTWYFIATDSSDITDFAIAGYPSYPNQIVQINQYWDGTSKTVAGTAVQVTPTIVSYPAAAPSAEVTGVTISPTSATVNGGESQTFTATVSGTGDYNSTVTYSATAGTITSAGVFTAPAATDEAQTITVTATSNGDNTKSATATVTVPAAAPVVPTPTATVDERGVVKGNDAADGQNTAVTKLGFANTVDPFVRITLGGDHKDYELPAGVKGGTASLIAILRYAKGTVGTFTIAVMDGGSTLIETTHVATDE